MQPVNHEINDQRKYYDVNKKQIHLIWMRLHCCAVVFHRVRRLHFLIHRNQSFFLQPKDWCNQPCDTVTASAFIFALKCVLHLRTKQLNRYKIIDDNNILSWRWVDFCDGLSSNSQVDSIIFMPHVTLARTNVMNYPLFFETNAYFKPIKDSVQFEHYANGTLLFFLFWTNEIGRRESVHIVS